MHLRQVSRELSHFLFWGQVKEKATLGRDGSPLSPRVAEHTKEALQSQKSGLEVTLPLVAGPPPQGHRSRARGPLSSSCPLQLTAAKGRLEERKVNFFTGVPGKQGAESVSSVQWDCILQPPHSQEEAGTRHLEPGPRPHRKLLQA